MTYQLDLGPPKRNVFVTQLHERDDDEDTRSFPVVTEPAGQVLETGLGTLQKTLVLRREVELDQVNDELNKKREEFQRRMEICAAKQIEIQKKQQQMRERVTKFDRFIKESESKRRRAIQKFQQEVRQTGYKDQERETLGEQLAELWARHEYLKKKLARYEKYEAYLMRVIGILPANYLEAQDSMLNSLMMRQRTLRDTNTNLVENVEGMQDRHETLKQELDRMQLEHNKMKLSINSRLSQMKKSQESKTDMNEENEQKFSLHKVTLRGKRAELGQIMMAIVDLSEKCQRHTDASTAKLSLLAKLDIIKDFVKDKADVVSMVAETSSSESSEKSPQQPKRKAADTIK